VSKSPAGISQQTRRNDASGSGATIVSTAPKDNQGDGLGFSPTDLTAGALGACMLTIMGILADRTGIDIGGAHAEIEKHMTDSPRRIGALGVRIHLPACLSETDRRRLETRRAPARCTTRSTRRSTPSRSSSTTCEARVARPKGGRMTSETDYRCAYCGALNDTTSTPPRRAAELHRGLPGLLQTE